MSFSQSVNVGGAIRALANLGFNPKDLLAEGIDNSLGVNATRIKITIDSNMNCITADNGPGMNRTQLMKRFRLYDDSPASDLCQGRFGIGEDVKHALLCEFKKPTKTITNTVIPSSGSPATPSLCLTEIELDWPTAVEQNEFHLHAHDASSKSESQWKLYSINSTLSGTIDIIPLSESNFKYFTENIAEILAHFERMYAENLSKGLHLTFCILDKEYILTAKDLLKDDKENEKTIRYFKEIRVWQKEDSTVCISFKDSKKQWVYKDGKTHLSEESLLKKGFKLIGSLLIDYAYNTNWQKIKELGGVYYKRNNKIIQRRTLPPPKGGDFDRQDMELSSRQVVTFTVKFDSLFGLEVNKSHIDKIHPQLEEEINAISHDFSTKAWNQLKKNQSVKPEPVVPVVTSQPTIPKTDTLDSIIKITPKQKTDATVQAAPITVPALVSAPLPAPVPLPVPTPIVSTASHPIIAPPKTPLEPTPPPPPSTIIQFSKNTNDSTITITEGPTVIFTLYYVGQAYIWENNLKQILDAVGHKRFKEYLRQLVVLNSTHLK